MKLHNTMTPDEEDAFNKHLGEREPMKTPPATTDGQGQFAPAHGSASLSAADNAALARLPDGRWFGLRDVTYMVKNPRWRCDRLAEKGVLESRVVGEWPAIETQWRKTLNDRDQRRRAADTQPETAA